MVFCDVTGRETRLPLTICAEGLPARLQLSVDTLDTGTVFTKTSHHYEVVLANRGLIPAEFSVRLPDTVFRYCYSNALTVKGRVMDRVMG